MRVGTTRERRVGLSALVDLSHAVLFSAVLIALVFIFFLYRDDIKQRRSQAELRARLNTSIASMAGPPYAQVGDIVPDFESATISGKRIRVTYSGDKKYLFFIFASDCDVCSREGSAWQSIASKTRHDQLIPLGLVTNPLASAVPEFDFDVLLMEDVSVKRAYRVVAVPAIMLVSGKGRIEWVHYGSMSAEQTEDLLSKIRANSGRE